MQLPLPFIGWFFTLISAVSLAVGVLLVLTLLRSGEFDRLTFSFWNDALLVGIWVLGLAGGIGVIRLEVWGRWLLELFCWALIVLILLSASSRLYVASRPRPGEPPPNWGGAIIGVLMIVIPILLMCGATIVTLRSPETLAAFRNG